MIKEGNITIVKQLRRGAVECDTYKSPEELVRGIIDNGYFAGEGTWHGSKEHLEAIDKHLEWVQGLHEELEKKLKMEGGNEISARG